MAAAVRCAARRLGGSLLQRTQAGERRQLVPSRLMRSRELSSEQAREIQQKKEALYDAVANAEQKNRELCDALSKAAETTKQHLFVQGTPQQSSYQRIMMYARRAHGVIELAAKTTCFVVFTASMVGLSDMKDRMSKLGESSEDNVEI